MIDGPVISETDSYAELIATYRSVLGTGRNPVLGLQDSYLLQSLNEISLSYSMCRSDES